MASRTPANARRTNRLAVLQTLLNDGPLRQAEIARVCGLSPSTVSTIVTEARAQGLIVLVNGEYGATSDGRGSAARINPEIGYVIGIDIGQSATRVALGNLEYQPLAVETVPSIVNKPSDEAAQQIVAATQQLIQSADIEQDRIIGVGVGMPSPQDAVHRTVEGQQIFPGWTGQHIRRELGRLLQQPVFLENDADAAALAEHRWGAGRGVSSLLHVLTHAGIGAGIVLDGQVYRGATGRAGEIGHISIDPLGPLCYCGNRGCLQTYAGGDAIVALLRPFHGDDVTIDSVIAAVHAGERTAIRAVRDAGRFLGRVLGEVANVLNPGKIIVSGYLASAGDEFFAPLRSEFELKAMHRISDVEILPSELEDGAAVRSSLGIVPIDLEQLHDSHDR